TLLPHFENAAAGCGDRSAAPAQRRLAARAAHSREAEDVRAHGDDLPRGFLSVCRSLFRENGEKRTRAAHRGLDDVLRSRPDVRIVAIDRSLSVRSLAGAD